MHPIAESACHSSSLCSSLGRAATRVVQRRRRCACARTRRRWSTPAVAATARRPGPYVESDKLLARADRASSPSIIGSTHSPATSCGREACVIRPERRRVARTCPARPRPLRHTRRKPALPPRRRLRGSPRCGAASAAVGSYGARGRAWRGWPLPTLPYFGLARARAAEARRRATALAVFVVKGSGSAWSKAALAISRRAQMSQTLPCFG